MWEIIAITIIIIYAIIGAVTVFIIVNRIHLHLTHSQKNIEKILKKYNLRYSDQKSCIK